MPNNNRSGNIQYVNSHFEMFQKDNPALQVDYSLEKERIKSFVSWPVHFPVDPIRLAKAGFYYTGNEDEVICFSCHGHVKDWNYGDIVQKKHSSLFPNCDFVNDRSNNIPLKLSKNQKQINSNVKPNALIPANSNNLFEIMKHIDYDKMKSLNERLKSFEKKWSIQFMDGAKLAKAGFFYFGCEDKVQCPFCKGIVSNWEVNDDPLEEHKKHFPWCDYLSNVLKNETFEKMPWFQTKSEDLCGDMKEHSTNKEPIKYKLLDKNQEHVNLKELGIHPYSRPAHPQQANLSARLRSFIPWPTTSPVSKEDLAKAGFFYIGIGDHTKCFHCNGGLCNWESGDDPWVEHAKWFCNCSFLRLNKGDEFVEACLKENISTSTKENSPEHSSAYFSSEPLMVKVDEAMKSNMVKYVLDSGLFPYYVVRVAVLRQIEETGSNFTDMNELCLAVTYLKGEMEKLPLKSEGSLELNNIDIRKCVIDDSDPGHSSESRTETTSNKASSSSQCFNRKDKLEIKEDADKKKPSEDQRLCIICMDKEVGVVFLPCGHVPACTECAAAVELCPMCRKSIQATIRVYLP